MWKLYDIRNAETNEYLGSVETETAFDAAILHFAVYDIKIAQIQVNQENPFTVTIEGIKYTVIEDTAAKINTE